MFYITSPIPYTNSTPHLGHLLEAVFVDTITRFYTRSQTDSVFLSMGVDQHGLKIYEQAQTNGIEPQEFVDHLADNYIKLWEQFEIRYDEFVKTSSPRHRVVAQVVWNKLAKSGHIYKKAYEGLYCKGCEDFYAPSQLTEDKKCPIHNTKPIQMNEENYFFQLSKFSQQIQEFLGSGTIHPSYIAKEQLNFVQEGLQDISISREKSRLPWGVPVPGDDTQVMYVWFEALINYFTAIVNPETIDALVEFPYQLDLHIEQLWKDIQDAMPINVMYISKEIAKFHLVIFIGILKALDLPLPQRALAHGLINDKEGIKFSKSLGNGVSPQEMVELFGVDGTRFLILHEINIDGDTNFNWDNMIESYNSHLANNIGNLVMRVTTLVSKNFDGLIDLESLEEGYKLYDFAQCYNYLDQLNPRKSLDYLLEGARKGNEYLESTKPWSLIKEGDKEKAQKILTQLAVLLKDLSEIISIFMPATGQSIHQIITADVIEKAQPLFAKVEKIEK